MNILDIRNVINNAKFNDTNVDVIKFNDQEVWSTGYLLTKQGYPLTLTNSLGKPLKDYKIYGNSIQNGTPTPTSPVEIESVGDKSTNLIPFTYNSKTINGVTITVNNDGSLTYNGIATASVSYNVFSGKLPLIEGKKYYFSDCNIQLNGVSGSYMTQGYTAKAGDYISLIWNWHASGTTFNNDLKKPMLATFRITSSNYEQPGYKIPIKASGKNLFNYATESSYATKVNNGYTSEGNYIRFYTFNALKNYVGQTATISFDLTTSEAGNFRIYQYQNNGIGIKFDEIAQTMQANVKQRINITGVVEQLGTIEEYSRGEIIVYKNGFAGTYTIENIQIELGSTATDYEPYIEAKTYNIYLDEPLRKIGEYADSIDYSNKKIVRHIKVNDDTGTKSIEESYSVLSSPLEQVLDLPVIATTKNTCVISCNTLITPSNMSATYKSSENN